MTGWAADVREVLDSLVPKEWRFRPRRVRGTCCASAPIALWKCNRRAVITFTEITEIKRAQAALRESEDLRRLAVVVRECARRHRGCGLGGSHPGLESGGRKGCTAGAKPRRWR